MLFWTILITSEKTIFKVDFRNIEKLDYFTMIINFSLITEKRLDLKYLFSWMNIGFEDDELLPYQEAAKDQIDEQRVEKLIQVGFGEI